MAEKWHKSDGETHYSVQLTDSGQIGFSSSGPGVTGVGPRDEMATIWIEEFVDSERWQEWVFDHLGDDILDELESAVREGLDDLDANREDRMTWLFTQLDADASGRRQRAIDRVRSVCQRYPDLIEMAAPKLADCLDRDEDAMRRSSAEALRRLAEEHAEALTQTTDALLGGLRDDNPAIRMESARALERIEREMEDAELLDEVVDTLASLLVGKTTLFSRGPVAGLIGEVGRRHPEVIGPALQPLVDFVDGSSGLGSSTSGLGRSTALFALFEVGQADFEVVEEHSEIFFDQIDSQRSDVRRAAAQGLGLVGARDESRTERATEALAERLDDSPFIRQEAIDALQRIHRSAPDVVADNLGDQLDEVLEDEFELIDGGAEDEDEEAQL